eukprot:TRINITY_DN3035_c0_g1_i2.p1 TRINITY_DN3035_c0_g1~~TRINITY_DN3035_c0_g1_i2.p1  ORF type:complete len:188 (-),score=39.80 TRINITY_DN3035_c0_g1_i2:41-604(-)
MAPELLKRERYGTEIDYWSVGVVLYEFFTGRLPFYRSRWEDMKNMIITVDVEFPDLVPEDARECIRGLLEKDPKTRWTHKEMSECAWLKCYDFNAVGNKLVDAPWVPDPKKAHVSGIHDLNEHFNKTKKPRVLTEEEQLQFENWDFQRRGDPNIKNTRTSSGDSTSKSTSCGTLSSLEEYDMLSASM